MLCRVTLISGLCFDISKWYDFYKKHKLQGQVNLLDPGLSQSPGSARGKETGLHHLESVRQWCFGPGYQQSKEWEIFRKWSILDLVKDWIWNMRESFHSKQLVGWDFPWRIQGRLRRKWFLGAWKRSSSSNMLGFGYFLDAQVEISSWWVDLWV